MNTSSGKPGIATEEDFSHCGLHSLEKQTKPEETRNIYDILSE